MRWLHFVKKLGLMLLVLRKVSGLMAELEVNFFILVPVTVDQDTG